MIDADYRGKARKLLLRPNRNGFFYVLDRVTGEFLGASANGTRIYPAVRGASNWTSPSFNPQTKLLYVPTLDRCDIYTTTTAKAETIVGFWRRRRADSKKSQGSSTCGRIDDTTGKRVWKYPMAGPGTMWAAGTVSAAGGVVFFGDDDGNLVAVDAQSGKHLWHYPTGDD